MSRRTAVIAVAALTIAADIAPTLTTTRNPQAHDGTFSIRKMLLWNASASVPRGLYWLSAVKPLYVGELVAATPPTMLAAFLARRRYLPLGVPLLKHVAALSGQTVCRIHDTITVDGAVVALALDRDRRGRALPTWQGCRTLLPGDVFFLNASVPDSLDGRYFGVLPATAVTTRAHPLWTFKEN